MEINHQEDNIDHWREWNFGFDVEDLIVMCVVMGFAFLSIKIDNLILYHIMLLNLRI